MTSLLDNRKDPQPIVAQYKDDFAAEIEQFNSKYAK
jgi:hypothetical protein